MKYFLKRGVKYGFIKRVDHNRFTISFFCNKVLNAEGKAGTYSSKNPNKYIKRKTGKIRKKSRSKRRRRLFLKKV